MSAEFESLLRFVPGEEVVLELRLEHDSREAHPMSPLAGIVVKSDTRVLQLQLGRIVTPIPLELVVRVTRPRHLP